MRVLPLVLSSDSHVFEPPDLWQTRIDAAFRDRGPRLERIDGNDQIVVEADQILSGIGLISNAGARFEAPETISGQGLMEDVHSGGYDPEQHLKDMELDGVAGEVLYPSQGLFYFKVADTALMSAIFRAYNDWLAEFCRTDPARLKGIAMINLDDVPDGIKELERAARLGLAGAMITEYPLEHRRYDQSEYEPFWAVAAALDLPLSLHTATRRQGRIRGAGDKTLRDASIRVGISGLDSRAGARPLRHPRAPGLSLTGIRLIIPDHAMGLPVLRALSLCTCCRHYPGAADGRSPRSKFTHPCQPSPEGLPGRPAHRPFRGLLSVYSRCGLHTGAVTNS